MNNIELIAHCMSYVTAIIITLTALVLTAPNVYAQPTATRFLTYSLVGVDLAANPFVWSNTSGDIVFASSLGVFISQDTGKTFVATMPDSLRVRMDKRFCIDGNKDNVIIVLGNDQAGTAGGAMMRSDDGGRSWSVLRPTYEGQAMEVIALDRLLKFYTSTDAWYKNWFTTDAGEHWTPMPEQAPGVTELSIIRLENGDYVQRSSNPKGWFQADIQSRTWVSRPDIPYELTGLVSLSNNVLMSEGWADGFSTLRVRNGSDSAWNSLSTIACSDGTIVDSFYVRKLIQGSTHYAIVITERGEIVRTDGLRFDYVDFDVSTGSHLKVVMQDGSRILFQKFPNLIWLDVETLEIEVLPTIEFSFIGLANKHLFAMNSTGRCFAFDKNAKRWFLAAFIDHPIARPLPFRSILPIHDRLLITDDYDGVYELMPGTARLNVVETDIESNIAPTVDYYDLVKGMYGSPQIYDRDGSMLATGSVLRSWRSDSSGRLTVTDTLFHDTVSVYTRTGGGAELVGFHDLFVSESGNEWQKVSTKTQGDTSIYGTISGIEILGNENIVISRRGYTQTVLGDEDTTIVEGGVYLSTDNGVAWESMSLPQSHRYVASMHKTVDGILWASTTSAMIEETIDTNVQIPFSVFRHDVAQLIRSQDNGRTWSVMYSQNYGGVMGTSARTISSLNEHMAAVLPDRAIVSSDYGDTWTLLEGIPAGQVYSVAYDSSGTLWIACDAGLFKYAAGSATHITYDETGASAISIMNDGNSVSLRPHSEQTHVQFISATDVLGRDVKANIHTSEYEFRVSFPVAGVYFLTAKISSNEPFIHGCDRGSQMVCLKILVEN